MSVGTYQQPILIVDDDEEVLESIELILNTGGYENVLSCQDSRQVLPLLKKHSDVQLILLDLFMPYLKGGDLLPILREQHSETPVIVVTAIDDRYTAVECMKSVNPHLAGG
jgi:DNA-binding NtrC family response regulator